MKITVKIDASGAFAKLEAAAKQVAYAQAVALTRTAQIVKTDLRAEMQKVFSSATNFTLSSLYVKAATQSDPVAIVGVRAGGRSSAANWLLPEIEGGTSAERHRSLSPTSGLAARRHVRRTRQ